LVSLPVGQTYVVQNTHHRFDKKSVKPAGYDKEMYSTFPTGVVIYGFIATLGFGGMAKMEGKKRFFFFGLQVQKKLQKNIQKKFLKIFKL
jgi:hypothetical protein